ncbi:uncharacterized protein LAJ45_08041 [Morchella importuna]|uniref:uncharacterized protein n=1 Tax=Morchella importuna TaxID=1174673 RepID=UPI001E8E6356|nr:uncharacterized protein LAJ45_08041 [Morchella importuna]KAH8147940.1 hypothetical protein LAJ45_08041 [Morchella importuna]
MGCMNSEPQATHDATTALTTNTLSSYEAHRRQQAKALLDRITTTLSPHITQFLASHGPNCTPGSEASFVIHALNYARSQWSIAAHGPLPLAAVMLRWSMWGWFIRVLGKGGVRWEQQAWPVVLPVRGLGEQWEEGEEGEEEVRSGGIGGRRKRSGWDTPDYGDKSHDNRFVENGREGPEVWEAVVKTEPEEPEDQEVNRDFDQDVYDLFADAWE